MTDEKKLNFVSLLLLDQNHCDDNGKDGALQGTAQVPAFVSLN